jgi:tetratricopeptide (TPR) repeat protein
VSRAEIDSAYPLAYQKLGDSLFTLGRYAEAVEVYQQAIALIQRTWLPGRASKRLARGLNSIVSSLGDIRK